MFPACTYTALATGRSDADGGSEGEPRLHACRIGLEGVTDHLAQLGEIDHLIDLCQKTSRPVVLVAIHSFTDTWKGRARPWHASVLWDKDDRLVRPFLRGLSGDSSLVIGENVPYSGELEGDTLNRHGTGRGIAHALVEIRQDLVREASGQRQWAERLARIIADITSDEEFQLSLKDER